MGLLDDDENLPVRSPLDVAAPAAPASDQDESDYSTLINIYNDITAQMEVLGSPEDYDLEEKELTVKEQIAVAKRVRAILEPIQANIISTVQSVQLKTKERS